MYRLFAADSAASNRTRQTSDNLIGVLVPGTYVPGTNLSDNVRIV